MVYWTGASIVTASRPRQSAVPLELFPNPATDVVRIANSTGQAIRSVTLTDLSGRVVRRFVPAPSDHHLALDLAGEPAGVYVVSLTLSNAQVVQRRLVKQ